METKIPLFFETALGLMATHAKAEHKDSGYIVYAQSGIDPHPEGPTDHRFIEHQTNYRYGKYSARVSVQWDRDEKTFLIKGTWDHSHGELDPETIIRVAGMLIKASNLLRQLKALR